MVNILAFPGDFPDDTIDTSLRRLHLLSKHRDQHPCLAHFLSLANGIIIEELERLPAPRRFRGPRPENLLDLCRRTDLKAAGMGMGMGMGLAGAVNGGVAVCVELGTLIGYYEQQPDQHLPSATESILVGLGVGLLAATALATAPTLSALPLIGAEAVRTAFRLGVTVSTLSTNLEASSPDDVRSDSWAYVVLGLSESEMRAELALLNEGLPTSNHLFISASDKTSTTISGSPSRLKKAIQESSILRYARCAPLPVYDGLCHAPHVYSDEHVKTIVRFCPTSERESFAQGMSRPLLSSESGERFEAATLAEAFEAVVREILTGMIRTDDVNDAVESRIADSATKRCERYTTFVTTKNPFASLTTALAAYDSKPETLDLFTWLHAPNPSLPPSIPSGNAPIAIVGMACRFPGGGDDLAPFWDLLLSGKDVHTKVPADRFNVDLHYDPTGKGKNTSMTPYGCFIDKPGLFDAAFFNMSAREAKETDPMHRLALVTAYEALERAGFVPGRTASSSSRRVGTFYGQASDDYREVNTAQDIGTYFIPGGCRAFAPGRVSYHFGFWGPSFSCDTACSSSLATIQQACTTLWANDADTIVAGGLNILTNSDAFAGLGNGHFLSSTPNACKTWDATADGYCRADGVGSLILRRLDDALADNDHILGVVLEAATNHSGDAISITHPHAGAQAELFRRVVDRAGVDPLDVNYVEFHGTGTQAGDANEMESVLAVFAPGTQRSTHSPLHIGAVKSNVGHGEAAAGIMALIKVLCMFQHDLIPPHVGIKTSMNPVIPPNLLEKGVHIPYEAKRWSEVAGRGKKRLAIVNNFSAAGGNTSLLLQEAPERRERQMVDGRGRQVVSVSAKSRVSLRGNVNNLMAWLEKEEGEGSVDLADLSYTSTARHMHHPYRICVSASSIADLQKSLTKSLPSIDTIVKLSSRVAPSAAFVFTGQGSMYPGAGKALYTTNPAFAEEIRGCDHLCTSLGFPSFVGIIDGTTTAEDITPLMNSLAIVCIEIALTRFWATLGIRPSIVLGHSLGEYAALYAAGVLAAVDAIYLIGKRAELVAQHCTRGSHVMLAVRASTEMLEKHLAKHEFEYACKNSPSENVIAGERAHIDAAKEALKAQGIIVHELDVPYAFHSAQMEPLLDEFEALAEHVTFKSPAIPVISPLRNKIVYDGRTFTATYLRDATRETVDFTSTLTIYADVRPVDPEPVWIEIGAHPVCANFLRGTLGSSNTSVVATLSRKHEDWCMLADACATLHTAGLPVDWNEYHRPYAAAHTLLQLPKYSWDNRNYWIQYRGTWALTKGDEPVQEAVSKQTVVQKKLTSSVHRVIQDEVMVEGRQHAMVVESDVMDEDFLAAAWGHKMNKCAVVTSSIHADIAFTMAKYAVEKLRPDVACDTGDMNMTHLNVLKGLIANTDTSKPQLIHIKAMTDLHARSTVLHWYNAGEEAHFASATVEFGSKTQSLSEWSRVHHLVQGRIEALEHMEKEGKASKLSKTMAYRLFANLVDYADKYRGMHSVLIHDLEAVADIVLSSASSGTWTIPPWFIDSVAHLAGFIMNGGDASETLNHFYVTPGWESMRFADMLVPGGKYKSYVKMRPRVDEVGFWSGDVYVLNEDGSRIIGMVGEIVFRRFPRLLLGKLFSPGDVGEHAVGGSVKTKTVKETPALVIATTGAAPVPVKAPVETRHHYKAEHGAEGRMTTLHGAPPAPTQPQPQQQQHGELSPTPPYTSTSAAPFSSIGTSSATNPTTPSSSAAPSASGTSSSSSSLYNRALAIIVQEAGVEDVANECVEDASFISLGIDSLLSLVLAQKMSEQLGIGVDSTQFLQTPTLGEFRAWVERQG